MAADQQNLSPTKTVVAALSVIATGALGGFLGDGLTKFFLDDAHPGAATIIAVLFCVMGVGVSAYYWIIFGYGAAAAGSPQRARYNRLRTALRAGGRIGPAYERMLRAVLEAVDRFVGDKADRTLFPRAFGLRERAPLWTAHSYDRCLLLAIVYPIAVIVCIWGASGHVGPAEAALRLPSGLGTGQRAFALACFLAMTASGFLFRRTRGPRQHFMWIIGVFGAAAAALIVALPTSSAGVIFAGICIAGVTALAIGSKSSGAASLVLALGSALSVAISFGSPAPAVAGIIGVVGLIAGAGVLIGAIAWAESRAVFGWLLLLWTMVFFLIVVVSPVELGGLEAWRFNGPLLFFLILLALVNAPFDWLTLGLTRALLRRGLELGGWWPLAFGLIDLFAAAIVVATLSLATLWAVQLFGHFTTRGGGTLVVNAASVLDALADPRQRTAPEYWWLYAMLISTLVPSIVNVALGALSLMRGIPGLHAGLARRMPVGAAVLESERLWMAPVLAIQAMLGVAVGLIVMLGLIWLILEWALPVVGLNLVSMLQALAAADLPGRLLGLLGL